MEELDMSTNAWIELQSRLAENENVVAGVLDDPDDSRSWRGAEERWGFGEDVFGKMLKPEDLAELCKGFRWETNHEQNGPPKAIIWTTDRIFFPSVQSKYGDTELVSVPRHTQNEQANPNVSAAIKTGPME